MSNWAGTWTDRGIAAANAIVIVVGAFGLSGFHHGNSQPKVHPSVAGVPIATPTAAGAGSSPSEPATPTNPANPTPKASVASSTSTIPTNGSAAPSQSHSAVPSQAATPTDASTGHAAVKLPPGVLGSFSYATTGYEQTAIPGTKRTYPKTTTITNTRQGSCVKATWKPNTQHTQSQLVCPTGKTLRIKAFDQSISFFGVTSGENLACSGDDYLYQPGVAAGHEWKYSCKSADAVTKQVAHVDGYSTMEVGGRSVRVLHVTLRSTLTGAETGSSTQDYWISTSNLNLIKQTATIEATQQGIRYSEAYSLTLDSLTAKS